MINPFLIWRNLLDNYIEYIDTGLPIRSDYYRKRRKEILPKGHALMQEPYLELIRKYEGVATIEEYCRSRGLSPGIAGYLSISLCGDRRLYQHQIKALDEACINGKNIVLATGTGSGKTECFLMPLLASLIEESQGWESPKTKSRKRGIRALILYPLNALAEDQMVRLRKALESDEAKQWLDDNRRGNRFYFGRYTSATLRDGNDADYKKAAAQWMRFKETEACDGSEPGDCRHYLQNFDADSVEIKTRKDMQKAAPDIFITNYSMLNVLLMRGKDVGTIFRQTKEWLEEREDNFLTIVLDEVHTYRGTAGTEVSYLLRTLLDRLGIAGKPHKVRYIASSASINQDDSETWSFLSDFFYTDARDSFEIISDTDERPCAPPNTRLPMEQLAEIGKNCQAKKGQHELEAYLQDALKKIGFARANDFAARYDVKAWLEWCLGYGKGIKASKIAKEMFPTADGPQSLLALEALVSILNLSRSDEGAALPMRAHYFARNIDHLWLCSNPECSELPAEAKDDPERKFGQLYASPKNRCACGALVYEAAACRSCGEIFLFGYEEGDAKSKALVQATASAEAPSVLLYAGASDEDLQEKRAGKEEWKSHYALDCRTGALARKRGAGANLLCWRSHDNKRLSSYCPQCENQMGANSTMTIIKQHVTGVQKVNQVFADYLMREIGQDAEPKLVLFSDSRQAAAKLSAGIELDHYRDALRVAVNNSLDSSSATKEWLAEYRRTGSASNRPELSPAEKEIRRDIRDEREGFADQSQIERINSYFNSSGVVIDSVDSAVMAQLAEKGINPAGSYPSMQNVPDSVKTPWYSLWDSSKKRMVDNGDELSRRFVDRFCKRVKEEILSIIFQSQKLSFESLGIGYVSPIGMQDSKIGEDVLKVAIRLLGEWKRIYRDDERTSSFSRDSVPSKLNQFLKNCFGQKDYVQRRNEVLDALRARGIVDNNFNELTGKGIQFTRSKPDDDCWICAKCRTVHLYPSMGICTFCGNRLEAKSKVGDIGTSFYLPKSDVSRLHCEELTGQTDTQDRIDRQMGFLGMSLDKGAMKFNAVDLLSVTTTMECGVDIGALSAVMLGNFPPHRFNYQQRVGRAGRRGAPLAIALTVAKFTSHDQAHYIKPELAASGASAAPYIDKNSVEILKRIVVKEIMYNAAQSIGIKESERNVHGSFGSVHEWQQNRESYAKWISSHHDDIRRFIQTFSTPNHIDEKRQEKLFKELSENLVFEIDEIVKKPEFTQAELSARLASGGLLPMFGFPTRVRTLYESDPKSIRDQEGIQRDEDMALNTFAPGCEIVKDKKVFKSIGFVDFDFYPAIKRKPGLAPIKNSCLYLCPVCGFSELRRSGDKLAGCPVCSGHGLKAFGNVSAPLGYLAGKYPEDFNGNYEWTPNKTETHIDNEASKIELRQVAGANLLLGNNKAPRQGMVHTINTNLGKCFNVARSRTRTDPAEYCLDALSAPEAFERKACDESTARNVVLVSTKVTGVLEIALADTNASLSLAPDFSASSSNIEVIKSAMLSWGIMLRSCMTDFLDVDSRELNVNFFFAQKDGRPRPVLYFSETLENGAGYASHIADVAQRKPDVFRSAILGKLLPGGDMHERLTAPPHLDECDASCYDCLRDYGNQDIHGLLNWRLGLDIAQAASNASYAPSLKEAHWENVRLGCLRQIKEAEGLPERACKDCDEFLSFEKGGQTFLIVHPLLGKQKIDEYKRRVGAADCSCESIATAYRIGRLPVRQDAGG